MNGCCTEKAGNVRWKVHKAEILKFGFMKVDLFLR